MKEGVLLVQQASPGHVEFCVTTNRVGALCIIDGPHAILLQLYLKF